MGPSGYRFGDAPTLPARQGRVNGAAREHYLDGQGRMGRQWKRSERPAKSVRSVAMSGAINSKSATTRPQPSSGASAMNHCYNCDRRIKGDIYEAFVATAGMLHIFGGHWGGTAVNQKVDLCKWCWQDRQKKMRREMRSLCQFVFWCAVLWIGLPALIVTICIIWKNSHP
jgi:hypothetical protein